MTDSSVTGNEALPGGDTRHRIWVIVEAPSGNLVEWLDFYIYSLYSLYFARIFFPSGNTATQLLQTTDVFVTGFLIRPIGGWLFDRIADEHGCKESVLLSVYMICIRLLVIACLPGYEIIDTRTPVLLLLTRPFRGLSVGDEYGASATYMSEVATEDKKGFYTSLQYVTLVGGQLLALLVVVILQHTLEDSALREWGQHIPFVLGTMLAIVVLRLHCQLGETSKQDVRALKEAGSLRGLWCNHKASVIVLGLTAASSLCFCTFTAYMQKYLANTVGIHVNVASEIMTTVLCMFMLVQPPFGALSDRIGRRTPVLCFGTLVTIFTVPILTTLQSVISPHMAFALVTYALLIVSFCTSASSILKIEMFPMQVHALGVGLSCVVVNVLLGGSVEYVTLPPKSVSMGAKFFWYVAALVVAVFSVSLMLHGKGKGLRL